MRCVVTGAAGFVGSHLCERLVANGHDVLGVDGFTDFYPRPLKEKNLTALRKEARFTFVETDLFDADLAPLFADANVVFHQAAQPGVGGSFDRFPTYVRNNVVLTQRLLEALRGTSIKKLVYASSSSVYGTATELPFREATLPAPYSPYGVTKLAAEQLVELYRKNFGIPAVSLRYFTVYGPRQRPDMGFTKFLGAALQGRPLTIYGDGQQTRDFTFISDIVEVNIRAATSEAVGVFNVGGGSRVTVADVVRSIESLLGHAVPVERKPDQPGDMRDTWADTTLLERALRFKPRVPLREGLAAQLGWMTTGG